MEKWHGEVSWKSVVERCHGEVSQRDVTERCWEVSGGEQGRTDPFLDLVGIKYAHCA